MKRFLFWVLIVVFCLMLTGCSLFGGFGASESRSGMQGGGQGGGTSTGTSTDTPSEHEHTYFDYWSYDETHHWHAASCEHASYYIDKEEHSFEKGAVVAPTYTADGYTPYVCSVCGYEERRDPTPQLVHYRGDSVLTAINLGRETEVDNDGFLTEQMDTDLVGRTYHLKFTMTHYFRYFYVEFRNPNGGYYGVDDVDVTLHQLYSGTAASVANTISLTTKEMDGKTVWVLADRSEIDSFYDYFCLKVTPKTFADWTVVAVHNDKIYTEMTSDTVDIGKIENRETYYFSRAVDLQEEMLLVLTLRVHYFVYNEETGEVEDTILSPYKSTVRNYNVEKAQIISGEITTNLGKESFHDEYYNVEGYRLTIYSAKEEQDPVFITLRFSIDKDIITVDGTDYAPYLEVVVSHETWS